MKEQSKTYTPAQSDYIEKTSHYVNIQDPILDKVFKLRNATEKDVYLYILRRNLAGQFESTRISYGEFERVLDRNRCGIVEAVKALKEKNYITVESKKAGKQNYNHYSVILPKTIKIEDKKEENESGIAGHTSIAGSTSMADSMTSRAGYTNPVGPAIPDRYGLLYQSGMACYTHLIDYLNILNSDEFKTADELIQKMQIKSIAERCGISAEDTLQLISKYVVNAEAGVHHERT